MRTTSTLVAALAVGVLSACASATPTGDRPLSLEGDYLPQSMNVTVENNNWHDVVIYALSGGMRTRLGDVTSMTRRDFEIRPNMVTGGGTIRFVADPIGIRATHTTQELVVEPGTNMRLTVENQITLSHLIRR